MLGTCTMGKLNVGEGGKCIHLESLAFQIHFLLLLGSPAPQRIYPRLHSALPVQAEGSRAAGAFDAGHPRVPGAPAQLRAPQRRPGNLHHLQVRAQTRHSPAWLPSALENSNTYHSPVWCLEFLCLFAFSPSSTGRPWVLLFASSSFNYVLLL